MCILFMKLIGVWTLVWPVATHSCEAWTLRKQEEEYIQAFENDCTRKLLRMLGTKLMTTAKVYRIAGMENELLNHKLRYFQYFGHVMRQPHDNVEGSVMVGLVEGVRNHGRQRMCWLQWQHLAVDWSIYTPWETERVGWHWLIHAANHCKATTEKWHDMTWTFISSVI